MRKIVERKKKDPAKRFVALTQPEPNSGCWLWLGKVSGGNGSAYGRFSVRKNGIEKGWLAHRWSYQNFVGKIPCGKMVLHSCDQMICVNPAHLLLGTAFDNMRHMKERNRNPWFNKPLCKLGHALQIVSKLKGGGQLRGCKICRNESTKRWIERNRKASQ